MPRRGQLRHTALLGHCIPNLWSNTLKNATVISIQKYVVKAYVGLQIELCQHTKCVHSVQKDSFSMHYFYDVMLLILAIVTVL